VGEADGSEELSMPVHVRMFEALAYLTLPIAVVSDYVNRHSSMRPLRLAVIWGISIAVCCLFIWLIARKRKNWARWLFVLLTFAGTISTIWTKGFDLHHGVTGNIAYYISYLVSMVCACLLLTPASAAWFRKSHS
jgi:predicted permease